MIFGASAIVQMLRGFPQDIWTPPRTLLAALYGPERTGLADSLKG